MTMLIGITVVVREILMQPMYSVMMVCLQSIILSDDALVVLSTVSVYCMCLSAHLSPAIPVALMSAFS